MVEEDKTLRQMTEDKDWQNFKAIVILTAVRSVQHMPQYGKKKEYHTTGKMD